MVCDIIILWGHTVDGKHPAPLMMPEKGLILDIKMDLGHPKRCRIFSIKSRCQCET